MPPEVEEFLNPPAEATNMSSKVEKLLKGVLLQHKQQR